MYLYLARKTQYIFRKQCFFFHFCVLFPVMTGSITPLCNNEAVIASLCEVICKRINYVIVSLYFHVPLTCTTLSPHYYPMQCHIFCVNKIIFLVSQGNMLYSFYWNKNIVASYQTKQYADILIFHIHSDINTKISNIYSSQLTK